MHLRARAPLRISFAGGGTDVAPFPQQEGGLVLSATIDRYAFGALNPREDGVISIESANFGVSVDVQPGAPLHLDERLGLIKTAISKVGDRHAGGYDLFLHSNAPPGSGLGSSSTTMVALVGLLRDYHGIPMVDYEVAALAHHLERDELSIQGGMQDHYAATFGGFNFIEFDADRVVVNPLRVKEDTVAELEHNCLLVYTGQTRASTQIIEDQTSRLVSGSSDTLTGLRMQKTLAAEMKNALVRGELRKFGEMLDTAWQHKKLLSPKISNDFIDEAYDIARKAGAIGGKVTGAGGGGYMLFYCEFRKQHRVAEALTAFGAEPTEFGFTTQGLTTWTASHG